MDRPQRDPAPSEDRIVLAGELALKLADGSERAAALRDDPSLAREVERWEEDLAGLVEELAPSPPSPRVWQRIAAAIRAAEAESAPAKPFRGVKLWRAIAVGSAAAAIVLGVLLVQTDSPTRRGEPQPHASLVAALTPKEGPPLFTATYDPGRRSIVVVPASFEPEQGRFAELWIMPKELDEPVALGRLDAVEPTVVPISASLASRIDEDAGIVVTSEPEGASVGASPPGPVIAHGRFAQR